MIGTSYATDFPTTVNAPQRTRAGGNDAVVTTIDVSGTRWLSSSYLGGSLDDGGSGVAVTSVGSVYVTGSTRSSDFATTAGAPQPGMNSALDGFIARLANVAPNDQYQCPCAQQHGAVPVHYSTRSPVNTRSGNYWTSATDLAVQTPGPALIWSRVYASQETAEISGTFGFGWQHPYATRIISPSAELGEMIVLSPTGNRERFANLGGGQFQPWPGIESTLVRGQCLHSNPGRSNAACVRQHRTPDRHSRSARAAADADL